MCLGNNQEFRLILGIITETKNKNRTLLKNPAVVKWLKELFLHCSNRNKQLTVPSCALPPISLAKISNLITYYNCSLKLVIQIAELNSSFVQCKSVCIIGKNFKRNL